MNGDRQTCTRCGEEKPLDAFATGRVRGLLCHGCNTALGKLGDTAEGLMRAVAYLLSASDGTYDLSCT